MTTKIIGNQVDAATRAIVTAMDVTEQINLPDLNTSQRDALGTPAFGTLVYNTTEDKAQIYLQDAASGAAGWASVGGGGPAVGENSIIRTNGTTISENVTVGPTANGGVEFTNGFTAGPVTVANGFTVTVENGATWMVMGTNDQTVISSTDITTDKLTATGTFHFSETKEIVKYYSSASSSQNHSFNDGNLIYMRRTGGGDYTLNLTNVQLEQAGYGLTIVNANDGAVGACNNLQINGVDQAVIWAGGGAPTMAGTHLIQSFAWINTSYDGQPVAQNFIIFASSSDYSTS